MLSFFPRGVLDEILNLIESVSEDFPSYSFKYIYNENNRLNDNIDVLQKTACLVVNPVKVNSYAYLFNCTTVGRASD